jgi:hypothetical protein
MSEAPYDYDQPGGQPPMGPDTQAAKSRVTAPAIFLIIVGVLNLIAGVFELGSGVVNISKNPAELKQQQIDLYKQMFTDPDMQKQMLANIENQDPQTLYNESVWGAIGTGVFWLVVSLVILFGGARMMGLRSYGLAVTGAILAAIPCVSCPGGCCFLGQIAGIWALIVLLNSDVRAAFR